ncbi:MAG: autoinducer binding domain-containing protein [Deltaproteobacteria bacterium]|nr:autoinducer binding domain-containing protein [Deltaproteobacteria bacterium]
MTIYNDLTKKELSEILDVIQSSIQCRAEEDIRVLLDRIRGLVCGDFGICGIGKGKDSGEEGLSAPPHIINLNYPMEWLQIYGANQLYYQDPIVIRNLSNPGSQLWDETYSMYDGKLSKLFLTSRDFGLNHGVSGGMYNQDSNTTTLFSFSGSGDWFKSHQKKILGILAPHLHQALSRIYKTAQTNSRLGSLSKREREIVSWVKAGKTNWEISMILNISERTVKFHVQNIERKLEAVNKAHAVAILMEQGRLD